MTFEHSTDCWLEHKPTLIWDIAGSKNYRRVWHSYIPEAHLVVFMIDGSDLSKLPDTEDAINEMLADESIDKKPVLFLVNKNVITDH